VETFLRRRWDLADIPRQWMAWRVSLPLMYKIRPTYDLATFTYEGFLEELLHRYRSTIDFRNKAKPFLIAARETYCFFKLSLCVLRVLCASVVNLCQRRLTTETQTTQRTHRERFKLRHLPAVAKLIQRSIVC